MPLEVVSIPGQYLDFWWEECKEIECQAVRRASVLQLISFFFVFFFVLFFVVVFCSLFFFFFFVCLF